MSHQPPTPPADFFLLDRPDILSMMFYPRPDRSRAPAGASDLLVPVGDGVRVHVRLYPKDAALPTMLFFHGNGEVVADYDGIAPIYHYAGLNLIVADYRGYGASSGRPTFSAMMADAHAVKSACMERLDADGFNAGRFLMGRSLGALSAVELAATDAERFDGLILESGAAGIRGWSRFARSGDDPSLWERLRQVQMARMAAITLPLLSIHGAEDELIPVESAVEVQAAVGAADKELVVIPDAGHNDLLAVGMRQYFGALTAFIARHPPRS